MALDPLLPPADLATWQGMWDDVPLGNPGYLGGDGVWSVAYPDSGGGTVAVLFAFGDTPVEGVDPITYPGPQATSWGSSFPNRVVIVDGEAAPFQIGTKVHLFQSDGVTLRHGPDDEYTVLNLSSGLGFTNVDVYPSFPVTTVAGDVLKLIAGGTTHAFPNSAAVLWSNDGLQLVTGYDPFIPPPDDDSGDWYWAGPMLAIDNGTGVDLYVFPTRQGTSADPGIPWVNVGRGVMRFSWDDPGQPPVYAETIAEWGPAVMWGAAVVEHGEHIYIYGTHHEVGWYGCDLYVARCPAGSIAHPDDWEFWTAAGWDDDPGHLDDPSGLAVLIESDRGVSPIRGVENTLSAHYRHGRIVLASKAGGSLGSAITLWESAAPVGPWTTRVVGSAPWGSPDPDDQSYLTNAHLYAPDLPDGTSLLSVSRNRAGMALGDFYDDPDWYRPLWFAFEAGAAEVHLEALAVQVDVPTPTVALSVTVTAELVEVTAEVPGPAVARSATAVPAVVPVEASVPAPGINRTATVAAATVAVQADIPASAPGSSVDVPTTVVAVNVAIPGPDVARSATAVPAVVPVEAHVPAPGVGRSSAALAPVVVASAEIPAPAIARAATVAVAAVAVGVQAPAPGVARSVVVVPAVIQAAASVPAAEVPRSDAATPAVVQVAAEVPTPAVTRSAVVAATVVAVQVAIPGGGPASSATVAAELVDVAAEVPSPGVARSATAVPVLVEAETTVLAPGITRSATALPELVAASAAVPEVTVLDGTFASPDVLDIAVEVQTPAVIRSATVLAGLLEPSAAIPSPLGAIAALAAPDRLLALAEVPSPGVACSAEVLAEALHVETRIPGTALGLAATATPDLLPVTVDLPGPVVKYARRGHLVGVSRAGAGLYPADRAAPTLTGGTA